MSILYILGYVLTGTLASLIIGNVFDEDDPMLIGLIAILWPLTSLIAISAAIVFAMGYLLNYTKVIFLKFIKGEKK